MTPGQRADLAQQRLSDWLDGLEMPSLDDPRRRLEEQCLGLLRNFLLLLLASDPERFDQTPGEALGRFAPGLARLVTYQQGLALPLKGSPDDVCSAIGLDDHEGELSELQVRLTDGLNDDGRRLILQLGRLF